MSDLILFYDLTVQSPVRANKCVAPNSLYDTPSNHRTHN